MLNFGMNVTNNLLIIPPLHSHGIFQDASVHFSMSWCQKLPLEVKGFPCLAFFSTKPCTSLKCLVNNHLPQYVTMQMPILHFDFDRTLIHYLSFRTILSGQRGACGWVAWLISNFEPKPKLTKKKSILFKKKNLNPKTLNIKKLHNKMQVLQNIRSHNQTQLLPLTSIKYYNKENLKKQSHTFHQMMEGAGIIKLKTFVQFFLCALNLMYVNSKTIWPTTFRLKFPICIGNDLIICQFQAKPIVWFINSQFKWNILLPNCQFWWNNILLLNFQITTTFLQFPSSSH